jgi:tetratricopeptide (TPR) repeat protein
MKALLTAASCILLSWPAPASADETDLLRRLTAIMNEAPNLDPSHREKALVRLLNDARSQGPDNSITATILNNLGTIHDAQGRYAEAENHYLQSIAVWRKVDLVDELLAAQPICNLAAMYLENFMVASTERLGVRPLASRMLAKDPQGALTARIHLILGHLENAQGQFREAERAWLHALRVYERTESGSRRTLEIISNLTQLYGLLNQRAKAQAMARRGLAIVEEFKSRGEAGSLAMHILSAALHGELGNHEQAQSSYRMALALAESALGPAHPATGRLMLLYAEVLQKCRRKTEASEFRSRGMTILDASYFGELRRHTVDIRDLVPKRSPAQR